MIIIIIIVVVIITIITFIINKCSRYEYRLLLANYINFNVL